MPFGDGQGRFPGQAAEAVHAGHLAHGLLQIMQMRGAADAVKDHPGQGQVRDQKLAKPCTRAAALRAMARASTTSRTGRPSHLAIWAVEPASLKPS